MENLLNYVYVVSDSAFLSGLAFFLAGIGNIFFPPIPVEMAAAAAGYLVSTGHGIIPVIIVAPTLGMFSGSVLLYSLAKIRGPEILETRLFRRFVNKKIFDHAVIWFDRYGIWALFLGKLVPGMNFCAVLASGILRMPTAKAYTGFALSNLAAFVLLAYAGKTAGDHWKEAYEIIGATGMALGLAVIVSVALYYTLIRRKDPSTM